MDNRILSSVLERLDRDFAFKNNNGYLRAGVCPSCKKKELYTNAEKPWVLRCGRLNKCGAEFHVKELYPDLFDSWSNRYKKCEANPNAAADAYLKFGRGFDLEKIKGWYVEESFYSRDLNAGSSTVRFKLADGVYWERIIDKPERFGKQKANFRGGYLGLWWAPPTLLQALQSDAKSVKEIWIVEGIFDAIALCHVGIWAVAAMTGGNYPHKALAALAEQLGEAARPKLVWALDGDAAGKRFIRKHIPLAIKDGWKSTAAIIPQKGRAKLDWNDMYQRDKLTSADMEEYLYYGELLMAKSAADKALIIHNRKNWHSFHFDFENRLFWFGLDLNRYHKARENIDEARRDLSDAERRELALKESNTVTEIANCFFTALYYQANLLTDESWYYFRVDFPHSGGSVKNTFSGGQVSSASEFKKRLLSIAPGAFYTGDGKQLDSVLMRQLNNIPTVETIDFIGYSPIHEAYVFDAIAVKGGRISRLNDEDFFELGKLSIKSLQRSVKLELNDDLTEYSETWLRDLWLCFGPKALVALAFWLGSLFAEQIRGTQKTYPFLEAVGEAGAGKSTLIEFLWKLCGRGQWEGFDPAKATVAARARNFSQVSNLPVVLIESDRTGEDGTKQRAFDWDELKTAYNGRSVRSTGIKNNSNDTYEPPFRGAIVISQNDTVKASEAILQRIVHLHFDLKGHTQAGRDAAKRLESMPIEQVSGFLIKAVTAETAILNKFHEEKLRFETILAACEGVKNFRIKHNHAQMMALVSCLGLVAQVDEDWISQAHDTLVDMAIEREKSIASDHPLVQEFWDAYDFLNGDEDTPVLNHSFESSKLIAINLNHFVQVAADKRQNLPPITELKRVLKGSRARKFIDVRSVNSRIHAAFNVRCSSNAPQKPKTVKCWVFQQA